MLWNELRYGVRLLRRSPAFTLAAVLSLALGIGANTAIFSLYRTIVLRMLPVERPEELVEFLQKFPDAPEARSGGYWDWNSFEHFRGRNQSFSAMTGTSFDNLATLHTGGADPETVVLENVVGNYFRMLGLKPAIGRFSGPEDVRGGEAGDVVVLSWTYWDRRFQRDPAVLGKRIFVSDVPKTVIGIAPRGYVGPRVGVRTDAWIPRERKDVTMLARLKPGVSMLQAQAEMEGLYRFTLEQRALKSNDLKIWQAKIELEHAGAGLARVRDQYGKPLQILMAVAGLLLLLCCVNLARIMLARSASRQREMAVRAGLGASTLRLVRMMLAESLLLSCGGAALGAGFAYLGTQAVVRIMASGQAHEHIEIQVEPDSQMMLYSVAAAILTGLIFGLAPGWHTARSVSASRLRQAGAAADTGLTGAFGKALVAAQVALSVFLVSGAVLFLDHLSRLRNWDLGFRSDRVLLVDLDSRRSGLDRDRLLGKHQELLARFEAIPEVTSASVSCCTPIQGCGCGGRFVRTDTGDPTPREDHERALLNWVAPRYFETLGIQLVAGRDFDMLDSGRAPVAIINQALARWNFPDRDAIGRHVFLSNEEPGRAASKESGPYEVIGVVGDAKWVTLREPARRAIYLHTFQEQRVMGNFALRTSMDPARVVDEARRVVRDLVPTRAVTRVTTLSDQVDSSIVPERLVATLSRLFGGLGVVLAGLGLYGLLSFAVSRRTHEIGVRMAIGASPAAIARMVLAEGAAIIAAGLAIGIVMVKWGEPLAARLVADLRIDSALVLLAGSFVPVVAGLAAMWVPLRRASRVEPLVALRHE